MVLSALLISGCSSSGISQEEYNKVVAERDSYKQLYEEAISQQTQGSATLNETVEPTEIATEAPSEEATKSAASPEKDIILYDDNDIVIHYKGIDYEKSDSYISVLLLIENNGPDEWTFQAKGSSVNGFMIDPTMSDDVMPGKKLNTTMDYSRKDLEANGISEIEDIELTFHAFRYGDNADKFDTEPITITP